MKTVMYTRRLSLSCSPRHSKIRLIVLLAAGIICSAPWCALSDPANGLVLHYTFDDYGNDNITDHSGHDNHGKVHGTRILTEGSVGRALEFNGIDSYILVPASDSLNLQDQMTVSLFFYVESYRDQLPLVSWVGTQQVPNRRGVQIWSNVHGYQWRGLGTGSHLLGTDARENLGRVISFANPPPGKWHHMVVTYDQTSGIGSLYINGTKVVKRTVGSYDLLTETDLVIGAGFIGLNNDPAPYFHGRIDDVRIYNRVLTAHDLADILRGSSVQTAYSDGQKTRPSRTDVGGFTPPTVMQIRDNDRQPSRTASDAGSPQPKVDENIFLEDAVSRHIVYIGFSSDLHGEEDVTHYYRDETLYVRFFDVGLEGMNTNAGVRILLYQHPRTPVEWDLTRTGNGWYAGQMSLGDFQPGRVYTSILAWNEFGITLRKDVELFIEH